MLESILATILDTWKESLLWLIAFFITFSVLAKLTPCNPSQPVWRKEILTDIIYSLILPLATRVIRVFLLGAGIFFLFKGHSQDTIQQYMMEGYGPLSTMPIWWQAAIIFLVSDFILYWTHRWFHGKSLWKFHAIHHSPVHVDWLSTYRFHPVNTWLTFTLVDVATVFAGFAPAAVASMATFNLIYSALVHANVNWTFGPFKCIFASPVFHRWHHTCQAEGMDKNFAPTFPLIDIAFGTFYMPEGRLPEKFGVEGSNIPSGFIGQMIWPFKKTTK